MLQDRVHAVAFEQRAPVQSVRLTGSELSILARARVAGRRIGRNMIYREQVPSTLAIREHITQPVGLFAADRCNVAGIEQYKTQVVAEIERGVGCVLVETIE